MSLPVRPLLAAVLMTLTTVAMAGPTTRPSSALDNVVQDIDGKDYDLAQHKGKVVLIVNTASKCGFTKQYAGLEQLYEKYKDTGLIVIGFPANDFKGQEPGSNEAIKEFCTGKFSVTFPMMAKVSVKGDAKTGEEISPVYKFLTSKETAGTFAGPIKWNFNKFLIGRDGAIVNRYDSGVKPDDAKLVAEVEKALVAK